jgi:hypothetical protein
MNDLEMIRDRADRATAKWAAIMMEVLTAEAEKNAPWPERLKQLETLRRQVASLEAKPLQ